MKPHGLSQIKNGKPYKTLQGAYFRPKVAFLGEGFRPFMSKDQVSAEIFKFDEFELDSVRWALTRSGRPVKIRAQPLRLLALLLERRGEIVSHAEIYKHLWGNQNIDHSGSLHVCVRRLRAALGEDIVAANYIENIPRRGYRFKHLDRVDANNRKALLPVFGGPNSIGAAFKKMKSKAIVTTCLCIIATTIVVCWAVKEWSFATRFAASPTVATDMQQSTALDAFRRGKYLLAQKDTRSIRESRSYFHQAIEADNSFAPAYSAMAESFQRSGDFTNSQIYAEKAAALDPGLADAQLRLGAAYFFRDWNWEQAEAHIERALSLDATFVEAHHAIATVHAVTGRMNSTLSYMEAALVLDPASTLLAADYGYFLYYAGDYDAALAQCTDALALSPTDVAAALCLVKASKAAGDYARAAEYAANFAHSVNAEATVIESIRSSNPIEGLRVFAEWQWAQAERNAVLSKVSISALDFALLQNALGNHEIALDKLELAFAERDMLLPIIMLDPEFFSLREDPQFTSLLKELQIEVTAKPNM